MMTTSDFQHIRSKIEHKMEDAKIAKARIQAFLGAVEEIAEGTTGLIPETDIQPTPELARMSDLKTSEADAAALLDQLVIIKLNGGLGTGMGLQRAKSLIPVKGEDTFLDFIARQTLFLREETGAARPLFYLMNSFSTEADTLKKLQSYPSLPDQNGHLSFLQGRVPKLKVDSLEPAVWETDPSMEWCPPGHGDIYTSLVAEGLLDQWLDQGIRYAFLSNSDNLGATAHPTLLQHFAESGHAFMMEVTRRTMSDRKGGHLAKRLADGRLILRESAQCPAEDQEAFQDIARHRYFNTNNLWLRLDLLKERLEQDGGIMRLPLIKNQKNIDPKNPDSCKVYQLETAMGAAIAGFDRSGAIEVGRDRFSPVKSTSDLLALRSDAYQITADHRLVLDEERRGHPPTIELDSTHYKHLDAFDRRFAHGVPSLLLCDQLHGLAVDMRFQRIGCVRQVR